MKEGERVFSSKFWLVLAFSALLALGVAACGDSNSGSSSTGDLSGEIAGAGSSAQEAAQEAWIANFQDTNPDVTISYDPVGSGGGREQFVAGGTAFGGSDAALDNESGELNGAIDRCKPGQLIQIPDYISPIAVIYNLNGVDSLRLSPDTLAGIFNQDITSWNDPAIAKDNPGVTLPDTRITPVNRSDESGTTENFVDYLSKAAPSIWQYPVDGNWPVKGGEAASGTSGVVEAVSAGDGAIGYADASQAGDLSIATVKVGSQYVGPTSAAAAKILEESPKDQQLSKGPYVFAYDLNRTPDASDTYPIVLVSYLLGCTQYNSSSEAAIVKGYFNYIVSPEGQQAAAKNAGSAPITDSLRSQIQPAVNAIQTGS
jgi:phosphate transport system substrate-binding protein